MSQKKIQQLIKGFKGYETLSKLYTARKVHATFQLNQFVPTISNLSKKINRSLNEVQEAIDYLESIKLISWEGSLPKVSIDHLILDQFTPNATKEDQIDWHRIVTHQILNDIDVDDRFMFRNGIHASDEATFKEFCTRFEDLISWYREATKASKKDKVFAFSFTIASVTRNQNQ